jgi:DNA-binding NtrC family response regulator
MQPEEDLRLAAQVDVPVLVTADSPDHRSMCARLIHDIGIAGGGPFVTFSTGGLSIVSSGPRDCEENVLRRQFERARGGTLFIDDIATLRAAVQAQLLSLLEERARHGSSRGSSGAPVRVVAGASRHLDMERATGAFCTPLFYRLNLIHINLIPRRVDSQAELLMSH